MLLFAAALIGAGCGDDDDGGGGAGTETGRTTTTAERPVPIDRKTVSAALNAIVAECIRRRRAAAGDADVSAQFDAAVTTLVEQYRLAPRRTFMPNSNAEPTTMEHILIRVRTSLAKPIPDGCAAEVGGPRQRAAVRELERALKRAQ